MRQFKLENGLTVIFEPSPNKTVAVVLGLRGDHRNDSSGLAHAFEHILSRATKEHPSWPELSLYARGFCDDVSGNTDETTIIFYGQTLPSGVTKVVRLLGEIITQPLITKEQVDYEIKRLAEERGEERISPDDWLIDTFDWAMYQSSGMGKSPQAFKKWSERFTTLDVRRLYRQLAVGKNLILVIAGNFNPFLAEEAIRKTFAKLKKEARSVECPTFDHRKMRGRIVLKRTPTEKIKFILGFPTFGFGDKKRIPLGLVRHLLITGNGSCLKIALDSKGYGYTSEGKSWMYDDVGQIYFIFSLFPEKFREALEIFAQQIRQLKTSFISAEDLRREKKSLAIWSRVMFDDPLTTALFYARQGINLGHCVSLKKYLALVNKVTARDAWAVSNDIFVQKRLVFVALGPIPKNLCKGDIKRILKLH